MIVTMISVRMMQVTVDEIVNVVAMWHRFVAAPGAMDVTRRVAAAARRTLIGIVRAHFEPMLIYMIAVRVMQVTVMQVIDVIVMSDRRVAAIRTVLMVVMRMVWFVTGAHGDSPRRASGGLLFRARARLARMGKRAAEQSGHMVDRQGTENMLCVSPTDHQPCRMRYLQALPEHDQAAGAPGSGARYTFAPAASSRWPETTIVANASDSFTLIRLILVQSTD
ncbi:hypothetical protein [Paraburkholderia sp. BL10I2N1]|uniref:hypothetical protein n=1 Tax=Paraburkholderia sp. BL10I2N1 TaxID=1938796 RepID=UPI001414F600|nr:hypothetical protein [Paraburkholderia sp. BL10I2N1]